MKDIWRDELSTLPYTEKTAGPTVLPLKCREVHRSPYSASKFLVHIQDLLRLVYKTCGLGTLLQCIPPMPDSLQTEALHPSPSSDNGGAAKEGWRYPKFGPIEKQIFDNSTILRKLLETKSQFGHDPIVDKYFLTKKKEATKAGPSAANSFFRDQFKQAMGDLNRASKGAIIKTTRWLDIGCAPGGFSMWLLEKNMKAKGWGITLGEEKLGFAFCTDGWKDSWLDRFTVLEGDVTENELMNTMVEEADQHGKFDLVIAGAIYRETPNEAKQRRQMGEDEGDEAEVHVNPRSLLSLAQLVLALKTLKAGGNLVVVTYLKPFPSTIAIFLLLRRAFWQLTPAKGNHLHRIRSSHYIVCEGFKASAANDESILNALENVFERLRDGEGDSVDWLNLLIPEYKQDSTKLQDDHLRLVLGHFEPFWEAQNQAIEERWQKIRKQDLEAQNSMMGKEARKARRDGARSTVQGAMPTSTEAS